MNMERLEKIFKIISFFDECRWHNKDNYNLINFYSPDLSDDEKILTHWLCYVMDRQMDFEIIWDVGGYVVSELVHEFLSKKDISLLDPNNNQSYIKKDNKGKYYYLGKIPVNNLIKEKYANYIENSYVKFKSRFFPSDFMCVLSTFSLLEDYNYCFSQYIAQQYKNNHNKSDFVIRLVFSLYLLTYYDIGQLNTDDIKNYKTLLQNAMQRKAKIKMIMDNKDLFENEYAYFKKETMFSQKRAWCSFRDFIKSKEFNTYFRKSMSNYLSKQELNLLEEKQSLVQFVLPGDVWNNNSLFRKCILKKSIYEKSNKSLNRILKTYFENKNMADGYPEQFDITFDFVPRMCDKHNCFICPIGNIDIENDFNKICVKNNEKYCSVALVCCNYRNECDTNCKLLSQKTNMKY